MLIVQYMPLFQKACELILDVIDSMPESETTEHEDSDKMSPSPGSGRYLLMLQCTEKEILPYCIQLLVACLKVSTWGTEWELGWGVASWHSLSLSNLVKSLQDQNPTVCSMLKSKERGHNQQTFSEGR